MLTPIAKIKDQTFYNEHDYYAFLESQANSKNLKVKYYKGLGTSSANDVKETFGKKVIRFIYDPNAKQTLNKVFHQKHAGARKQWMEEYNPKNYSPLQDECPITHFIDNELIRFSIDDCRRNLPNLFDGLKLSQRKILYSVFKKNLVYQNPSMKVAQLAGYVAEVSNYHHGEQCLFDTIIRMTHSFVGSNNVPLLYPDGQFGSRISLGKDAANGRYIFTKLQPHTSVLFSKDDEPLLHYLYDDNEKVEPEYYMPIIPMILVNGCNTGIGTGWSCTMPNYNPQEIISNIYEWIDAKEALAEFNLGELTPYWDGFEGTISKISESKYMSHGVYTIDTKQKCVVTEIPVNVSIDRYKEFLESLVDERKIRNLKNYSTTNRVHFEFVAASSVFVPDETSLKLTSTINLTNMVLFGKDHKLQKFESVSEIFETFCEERYKFYDMRKCYKIKALKQQIQMMENKSKFLDMILSQQVKIQQIQDCNVSEYLVEKKFDRIDGDFSYLLNIPVRQMTKTKLLELTSSIDETKTILKKLQKTSLGDLWKNDLKSFKGFLEKTK
jgi:DNA topoisomerase-2